ncbi:MAG: hypothetical protein AAFX79_04235 [Planctomycetota bacterium]
MEGTVDGSMIALISICGGLSIAVLALLGGFATSLTRTREREKTAREVAAYLAEGSINVEEAERVLKAAHPRFEMPDLTEAGRGCRSRRAAAVAANAGIHA